MYQLVCACIMLGYQQAQDRVGSWFLAIIYLSESPAPQNPYVLAQCPSTATALPHRCCHLLCQLPFAPVHMPHTRRLL
jgi:hypothetical protein